MYIQKFHIKLFIRLLFIALFILPFKKLFAEDTIIKPNSTIMVMAKAAKDSIILRWAPTNYEAWKSGNIYGYRVFRSVFNKNQKPVELTSYAIILQKLDRWKELVMKEKYAIIAAQTLFGDSSKLETGINADTTFSQEKQQMRFSIALFAADLNPEIAHLSGLYYVDKTAVPGEKYLYYIIRDTKNDPLMKTDTGFVVSSLNEYKPLPVPTDFKIKTGDKQMFISWNAKAQIKNYIAYFIEKSFDGGKSFSQIHTDPIAYIEAEGNASTGMMYKFDSLQQNNKEYFYRIRGISSFGEYGPYSQPIKAIGKAALTAVPDINQFEILKDKVKIFWSFPIEAEKDIACFKILRSGNDQTGFVTLNEKISVKTRNFIDNLPLSTGYYKVVAWQDSSSQKESFPFLVQLSDSIPPARPEGLTGAADTSGIVKLSWTPNKEKDLFGYRVFRSASNNDEYSQLTNWPVKEPGFSDTISKKDLNSSVFYKIMAVDQRQNQSEFSKILEVKKPDLVPPVAPIFQRITAKKEGIEMSWIESSSTDVAQTLLFRKYKGDSLWSLIKDFPVTKNKQDQSFTDKSIEPGKQAQYKLEAIDKSGNHSAPAFSIEIQAMKSPLGEKITGLEKSIDDQNGKVKISWKKPEDEVDVFWIYRKTDTESYSLYETVDGASRSFTDKGLKAGNKYFYRIKAIYKDKTISAFSEEINCNF